MATPLCDLTVDHLLDKGREGARLEDICPFCPFQIGRHKVQQTQGKKIHSLELFSKLYFSP